LALPVQNLPSPPPPASSPREISPGLTELDDHLVSGAAGVTLVRAPVAIHAALAAHAARRLRGSGRVAVTALGSGGPVFRELAARLGICPSPTSAPEIAEAVVRAAEARGAALVAELPVARSWDAAVADLVASHRRVPLVLLTDGGSFAAATSTFEIGDSLTPSERQRVLVAMAADGAPTALDLASLEAWWSSAQRAPTRGPDARALSSQARALFATLAAMGQPCALEIATTLGPAAALEELVALGLVSTDDGLVAVAPVGLPVAAALRAGETDRDACSAAASALESGPDEDPWALARAGELRAAAGELDVACALFDRACRSARDVAAARELLERWHAAVGGKSDALLRAAACAVTLGEAGLARDWCEPVVQRRGSSAEATLLMGRALTQLGDLATARVWLKQAHDKAATGEDRGRAWAALAEVAYLAGKLEEAADLAKKSSLAAETASTRLAGRNTQGKVLLALAKWDEADAHFAEDAALAQEAADRDAELRARINRGIALMSRGRLEEARRTFERVYDDGKRYGVVRACAHALSNLAVIAHRRHDYGRALELWEETVRFPQALRGRIATARTLANLAELRVRLGLVDHAEHAIAFGRRLVSGGACPVAAAYLAVAASRAALARGRTDLARKEADAAVELATSADDRGDRLPEAYVVSARVALEDGDVAAARDAIGRATEIATNDRIRAEVALCRALSRRARGESALEDASAALALATKSGDQDLLVEIHALLATLHRDADNVQSARAHARRAAILQGRVADDLPSDVRAAYLARPESVCLSRLQASLAVDESAGDDAPSSDRVVHSVELRATAAAAPREIVGDDPQIKALLLAVKKVGKTSSTVLVHGESGTGKELVAEALHRASDRADGPFVAVNCAALVETLLLSELFGHEKGAFTGASARRRGRFEMAEGGTLFLDEIGDISARTQVALLRVLQEKTFERVGGTAPIRANVRVVCATHRDLKAMVERGEFREDLYYRLRGITLEVPALRVRAGDLPKISDHLLARIAEERGEAKKRLDADAADLLCRHRWPGNVRELENVLRAVTIFAEGDSISARDLVDNIEDLRVVAQQRGSSAPPPVAEVEGDDGDESIGDAALAGMGAPINATHVAYTEVRSGTLSLADMKRRIERDCIVRALTETGGNITRAATLLGMKRPRLSQLVKQYGLFSGASEEA